MSDQHPTSHILDGHKLQADGRLFLFELTPSVGTGTFRFKEGADATWLGNTYYGVGLTLSGDGMSSNGESQTPRLSISGDSINLTALKPLIHDGSIDGALVVQRRVLLADLIANNNISYDRYFRVKRPDQYSSRQVTLILSNYADNFNAELPFRKFVPPAFPYVSLS